jgi:type I restriction enzyme S subunit
MTERVIELSELVEIGAGRPRSVDYPLPILRVADVLDGKIETSIQSSIPDAYSQAQGPKVSMPGDIVLTTKGTVGRVAIMPPKGPRFAYSPQLCYFRPRADSSLRPLYLYYWFKSEEFWTQANALKGQTDMADFLSLSDIQALKLRLPSLEQQAAVTEVLAALDDKIALNERLVATADNLLATSLDAAINGHPERFADQPLSQLAEFINGKAFTKDATGNGRMVVRIAEINSGPGPSTVYNDIEVAEQHLVRPGDVLFAWSGSLALARWYRPEAIINQHIFKVIPRQDRPNWLVFELVRYKLAEFRAIAADKATTMGHIQRRHLDAHVPVPTTDFLSQLDLHLRPVWSRALSAEQESLALATLRDTLLPELMSGQLRVRDAERIVEDAV